MWMGDFFDIRAFVLSFLADIWTGLSYSATYTLVSPSIAYTGCIGKGSCRILLVVPISQQVSCGKESCTRRCVVHVTCPRQ
ncbi:hypothetical protein EDC04DRAFT_2624390 [Pisolithus marmoratus]|nr:hypothetical protein EDC04DRAFT_2624390 [Pisolithus marmoratus]